MFSNLKGSHVQQGILGQSLSTVYLVNHQHAMYMFLQVTLNDMFEPGRGSIGI